MENTVYGNKYEATKGLDIAAIAKLVRADIKAAIAAGEIPAIKTSVKIDRYAGGQSLNIRVTAVPAGFLVLNPETVYVNADQPHAFHAECHHPRYTDATKVLLGRLSEMLGAYNYDGSDTQRDYFHVRFYGHAEIEHELETTQRQAILAKRTERGMVAWDAVCLGETERATAILAGEESLAIRTWKGAVVTEAAEMAPAAVGVFLGMVAFYEAKTQHERKLRGEWAIDRAIRAITIEIPEESTPVAAAPDAAPAPADARRAAALKAAATRRANKAAATVAA